MTLTIILFATGHIHSVWNLVPTAAYTKTDGMSSTGHSATAAKSVLLSMQSNTGRNLPFNLHAKRSIEHIVILIGRVDKPRPGQWLFDYTRVLSQFCERDDRVTSGRARGGRERFIRRVSRPRRVMRCSFIAQSNFFSSFSSPLFTLFVSLPLVVLRLPLLAIVRSIHARRERIGRRSRTRAKTRVGDIRRV